jgi:hypothetical protein
MIHPFHRRGAAILLILAASAARVTVAEEPEFDVVVGAMPEVRPRADHGRRPASAEPEERGTVSLSILPRAGFRLLADGPLSVRLSGEGLVPERTLLRREDAVDPRAEAPRFELPFRRPRAAATAAAPATLTATLTFYICRGERCRPVTEPIYIRDRTP